MIIVKTTGKIFVLKINTKLTILVILNLMAVYPLLQMEDS